MRPELRKNPRRSMGRRHAKIELPGRESAACVVTDISDSGAKLGVATDGIPDIFTLSFQDAPKIERACSVVWRSQKHLGVRFLKQPKGIMRAS